MSISQSPFIVRTLRQYKVVKRGQFAYATIHLDEGSIDYLRNEDAGLISPMYTVFETNSEEIDNEIALRQFKRFALSGRFDPYSNGGVNRRKSILFSDLSAFKFGAASAHGTARDCRSPRRCRGRYCED